mmetsp:Transcript_7431/g.11727  ORF Transcript_7431/g.11727 Transcript_7431/m.11727 type:complete len:110 (-) Transcript_7431:60-389(-)
MLTANAVPMAPPATAPTGPAINVPAMTESPAAMPAWVDFRIVHLISRFVARCTKSSYSASCSGVSGDGGANWAVLAAGARAEASKESSFLLPLQHKRQGQQMYRRQGMV